MAIALRGAAVVPAGNPTTGFTVVIPAEVVAGDIVVIAFTSRDHTSATAHPTVTDDDTGGNTWTQLNFSAADRKAQFWAKYATSGTAGKTVTVAGCVGSASGVLKAFSGVKQGVSPLSTLFQTAVMETNASGDESHASYTPTDADSMVLAMIFNYANDNAVTSLSFATLGATTMTEKLSTGGLDCATAFGHALQSGGPAATGTLTWAQTNGTTYSLVRAIQPAPSTQSITAAGAIASAEGLGTATVSRGPVTVSAAGAIGSAEALGIPTVTASGGAQTISGAGAIVTAEASGTSVVTPGPVAVSGTGAIAPAEAFGTSTVSPGPVTITGVGALPSAEAVGAPTVTMPGAPQTVSPVGFYDNAAFGMATVTAASASQGGGVSAWHRPITMIVVEDDLPVAQRVRPSGIATAGRFGVPTLRTLTVLMPQGIAAVDVTGRAQIVRRPSARQRFDEAEMLGIAAVSERPEPPPEVPG